MPHHLWCRVTDQRFDLLGLLPDLDLQSHCSNQCQLRTRGWRVLLQCKTNERKGTPWSHCIFFSFLWKERKKKKQQQKGSWENQEKTKRRSSRDQKLPQDICATGKSQLNYGCSECCSAQQQLDALVGISGDIAGSLLRSPLRAGAGSRGSGCETNWLGISAEPSVIPLHASQRLQNIDTVCLRTGSCSLKCRREVAAFIPHFCEEIYHFRAKKIPLL